MWVVALYQTVFKLPQDDCPLKLAVELQLPVDDNETIGADGIKSMFWKLIWQSVEQYGCIGNL